MSDDVMTDGWWLTPAHTHHAEGPDSTPLTIQIAILYTLTD